MVAGEKFKEAGIQKVDKDIYQLICAREGNARKLPIVLQEYLFLFTIPESMIPNEVF